jgi:hypothetical protein
VFLRDKDTQEYINSRNLQQHMKPFRRKDSSSQTMKRDKIVVGNPSTPYLRPNILRLHESLLCRAQLGLKLYYESYRISTFRGSNCGESANGYRLNDRVGTKNLLNHLKGWLTKVMQQTRAADVSTNDYKGLFSHRWGKSCSPDDNAHYCYYGSRGQITEYSVICGTISAN